MTVLTNVVLHVVGAQILEQVKNRWSEAHISYLNFRPLNSLLKITESIKDTYLYKGSSVVQNEDLWIPTLKYCFLPEKEALWTRSLEQKCADKQIHIRKLKVLFIENVFALTVESCSGDWGTYGLGLTISLCTISKLKLWLITCLSACQHGFSVCTFTTYKD